jgi:hypothetical protein
VIEIKFTRREGKVSSIFFPKIDVRCFFLQTRMNLLWAHYSSCNLKVETNNEVERGRLERIEAKWKSIQNFFLLGKKDFFDLLREKYRQVIMIVGYTSFFLFKCGFSFIMCQEFQALAI